MRKNLLTTLLLILVFIASAQEKEQEKDANKFYVKGGYTLKGKNYYGVNDSKDSKFHDEFWTDFIVKGGNLELGSLFYIDQIKLGEKFGIGINVDYLTLNFMSITNSKTLGYDEKIYDLLVGAAVGPMATYRANKAIAFDLYFKVNPVWFAGNFDVAIDKSETTSGYIGFEGMKYKLGFNVRLDFFVLSAEFNPGAALIQDYDISGSYLGSIGKYMDYDAGKIKAEDLTDKTPFPVFNFNIGFNF